MMLNAHFCTKHGESELKKLPPGVQLDLRYKLRVVKANGISSIRSQRVTASMAMVDRNADYSHVWGLALTGESATALWPTNGHNEPSIEEVYDDDDDDDGASNNYFIQSQEHVQPMQQMPSEMWQGAVWRQQGQFEQEFVVVHSQAEEQHQKPQCTQDALQAVCQDWQAKSGGFPDHVQMIVNALLSGAFVNSDAFWREMAEARRAILRRALEYSCNGNFDYVPALSGGDVYSHDWEQSVLYQLPAECFNKAQFYQALSPESTRQFMVEQGVLPGSQFCISNSGKLIIRWLVVALVVFMPFHSLTLLTLTFITRY